jgi:hypothetical protein
MKIAKILKVVVIVEWVLGFILGILAGISGGYVSLYNDYADSFSRSFSFWPAIIIWIFFFLTGIFQFGFAVLLENVAIMRHRNEEQLYYLTGAVQRLDSSRNQVTTSPNGTQNV